MSFENLFNILKGQRRFPIFSKRLKEAEALGRWEAAVGPNIAKHARAIRIEEGVLWVEVEHPIWRSELHHRKHQILKILNGEDPAAMNKTKLQAPEQILTDIIFLDPARKTSRKLT